jgi:hypothetical protein
MPAAAATPRQAQTCWLHATRLRMCRSQEAPGDACCAGGTCKREHPSGNTGAKSDERRVGEHTVLTSVARGKRLSAQPAARSVTAHKSAAPRCAPMQIRRRRAGGGRLGWRQSDVIETQTVSDGEETTGYRIKSKAGFGPQKIRSDVTRPGQPTHSKRTMPHVQTFETQLYILAVRVTRTTRITNTDSLLPHACLAAPRTRALIAARPEHSQRLRSSPQSMSASASGASCVHRTCRDGSARVAPRHPAAWPTP